MERITICLEKDLLRSLDEIIDKRHYPSRSGALSEFVRRASLNREFNRGKRCLALICAVMSDREEKAVSIVRRLIMDFCGEGCQINQYSRKGRLFLSFFAEGLPEELQDFSDRIRAVKGVSGGAFSIISQL